MKRVLFLTARVPAPLDDGWKIRTFHLLKGFAENRWQVDLLSFCNSGQSVEDFPELQSLCNQIQLVPRTKAYSPLDLCRGLLFAAPFHVYNYRVQAMVDLLQGWNLQPYDLVQIEDVVMAQYLNKAMAGAVRILDMHNVESDLLHRYAEQEKSLLKKIYAQLTATKLTRYEGRVAGNFHQILVCSGNDRDLLSRNGLSIPVRVVPNGVDCEHFHPVRCDAAPNDLVFVGSMDYHANISGAIHFVRNILPLIWQKNPGVRFTIVGKNPPDAIRRLAEERIIVTGMVPDVRPYFAQAQVVVVPLLVGGGTRLKILEAMAMGKPVVSTTLGAEGIPARHGKQLLLADEREEFAKSVIELLKDQDKSRAMGQAARKFVEQNFAWSSITRALCLELPTLAG